MTGAGAVGVRELARRVGRDVKGVHTDAQALMSAGVVERTDDGKLLFPYDEVRLELVLKAA
jgi:predicted transcriptional regulator